MATVLATGFTAPATAAGNGLLDLRVTAVDSVTGDPLTAIQYGQHQDKVAYRVEFACNVAACDDTAVQLAPSPADPFGLAAIGTTSAGTNNAATGQSILTYESFTKPAGMDGATIAGDDTTGKVVTLGDLASGDAGSFLVVYTTMPRSGLNASTSPAQFYPDGYQIPMSATISSPSATGPLSDAAGEVTWHIQTPDPGVGFSAVGTVKPDVNVSHQVRMGSGSIRGEADTVGAVGGNIYGFSKWIAAGNFTTVATLDPKAVYVSDNAGGVYDPVAHTVTWSRGTATSPTYWAAGGWGSSSANNWNSRGSNYFKPNLVLSYPAANFSGADADGCNFSDTVTNKISTMVTYLDNVVAADRTTKTADVDATTTVACYTPFGRAAVAKGASGNVTGSNPRVQYVPESGSPASNFYWSVTARNGGNRSGVAVITDDTLDQADAHVYRIQTMVAGGTINYELNTGVTGTATTTVDAPSGTWFVKATVTTASIAPVNIVPSGTSWADSEVRFHYLLASDAPVGETRTNSASLTMTYPTEPELVGQVFNAGPSTATVIFSKPNTRFAAQFDGAPVVAGGGNAVPGSQVIFKTRGVTTSLPVDKHITPQYVFVAPVGWEIVNGSASFATGSVPAGVVYGYTTKSIDGVDRQVVVASWPDTVEFGRNTTWPSMSVVASPTALVVAGTNSVAHAWISDSRNNWDDATADFAWNSTARVDSSDVDSDLNLAEWFATTSQNISVSAADRLLVMKEVCVANSDQADGCAWQSNPDAPVYVAPGSTDLKYRVTVKNGGNTALSNVVAYDVLPYSGDTGITATTAATPRGSDFPVTVNTVSDVSSGLTLAYSGSTNPSRSEVYPGAVGTTNDWNATAAGKQAIRATVDGTMQPGDTKSFAFTVALDATAQVGDQACNSVAGDSNRTLPAEPRAVCIQVAEADLAVDMDADLELQVGRPGIVTFDVVNHGPSTDAPATVTIKVPTGLTVTDLAPTGWICEDLVGQAAPIVGPVTLTCAPVDTDGDPRALALEDPQEIKLPVKVSSAILTACVDAEIVGVMHDPVAVNNVTAGCLVVGPATAGVAISKTDGLTAVRPGDTITYTLKVTNTLIGETIDTATVTDVLPAELTFVSATGGATRSGQTLTWDLTDLTPGEVVTVTVTATVAADADNSVVNIATVFAPDPAGGPAVLTATDTDTDLVRALSMTKASDATAATRVGDTVNYTVTVTNVGPDAYPVGEAVVVTDDLSDVLDDATFNDDAAADRGGAPDFDAAAMQLTWSGGLPGGASVVITYSVKLAGGGDGHVVNEACIPAAMTARGSVSCAAVTTELPKLTVTKATSATELPAVGDELTYTVTVENTSKVDFTTAEPATMVDDLSDVLDDATFDGDDTSADIGAVTFASPELSWAGALPAGDTATIAYTVTYTGAGDRILINQACIPASLATRGTLACATTQALGAELEVAKTVDPPSGTSVRPGDELTYTIELKSTGETAATVLLVDDLTAVLDDATLVGTPTSSHTAVTVGAVGGTMLITGRLPKGEAATITYVVRVKSLADQGDRTLDNFVGAVPAGGVCLPANQLCTTNPVAYLTVEKTNDASTHAAHGDTVTYTVKVKSAGPGDFTPADPARMTDDLAGVLDDATVTAGPSTDTGVASFAAAELSWSGALASGATSVTTYAVAADLDGDLVLRNTACVPNGTDAPSCASVVTPLAKILVDKTSDPASGGSVAPGDDIGYKLRFINLGSGPGLVDYTDHLASVLDDATLTGGLISSSPGIVAVMATPQSIAVSGELAGKSQSAVTYAARVTGDGDGTIENFLVPTGTQPPVTCADGSPAALTTTACTVSRVVEPDDPEDTDADDVAGEPEDRDERADRDESLLPEAGSPVGPVGILVAFASVLAGIMMLRRRGEARG